MGKSPSETVHWIVTGWPAVMASSLNSNGTTRGTTEFVNKKVHGTLNFTF